MLIDDDSMSSDGTLSDRALSEAATSDSGKSDDMGTLQAATRATVKANPALSKLQIDAQLQAKQTSEYTKKALAEILNPKNNPVRSHDEDRMLGAGYSTDEDAGGSFSATARPDATNPFERDEKDEEDAAADQVNLAALAADRKVIQARLKELQSCTEWLRRLSGDISEERNISRESTHTACEAVRRRFDVLRSVIEAKEKEFLSIVEDAGRSRLEHATRVSCDATTAVSEMEGFITQLEIQLDRLDGNRKLFDESRRSMLEATQERVERVDRTVHQFQDELDAIRSTSLGVQIRLDEQIETVQRLIVPGAVSKTEETGRVHEESIRADKFLSSPGVKVKRQEQPIAEGSAERQTEEVSQARLLRGRASDVAPQRRNLQQEMADLRRMPMERVVTPTRQRTDSPSRLSRPSTPTRYAQNDSHQQQQPALPRVAMLATQQQNNSGISRIASKADNRQAPRSLYPKELEKLRAQVASAGGGGAAPGGPAAGPRGPQPSSLLRRGSPVDVRRTNSPMRTAARAANSPVRQTHQLPSRTISPMRRSGSNTSQPAITPGPGSYQLNGNGTFGTRSVLSTPPRRR